MAGRRAMRPSAGGGGGGGMARGLAAAAARASSPAASFLLAAAAAAALVGALYFWVVVASFCLPERGATGCLPDGEGSWAIEMYYGNSPLQLRPIELEGRSNANSSAWPVANPVLTCATATEAGYPSNFVADPFLYVQGDTLFLFFETKTTTTMHGDIAVARSSDQGATWEFLGIALDEAWHLSYPFVFKYENEIYMMPEGNKKKDLRLYRATKFPLEWTLEKVLINKPLIDAALIQFEGIWRLQEQLVTDLLDIGSDVNPSYIIFSQVQITLERGIPALIGSFASKQLPYPYLSFDMVHCAKCNVDWDKNGDGQGHQAEEVDKVTKPRRWTMSPSRGATLRICHSLAVGEGAGWTQWRKRWRSDQWQGILPHPCTMLYLCTVNAHSIPRKKCLCCKGLSGHIIRCNSCEPKLRGFI